MEGDGNDNGDIKQLRVINGVNMHMNGLKHGIYEKNPNRSRAIAKMKWIKNIHTDEIITYL